MDSSFSGIDPSVYPTYDMKGISTVPVTAVPKHNRTLSPDEIKEMRSYGASAYAVFCGSSDFRHILMTEPPQKIRDGILHKLSDKRLVALLFVSVFYFNTTLKSLISNWTQTALSDLIRLIWMGKFSLQVDSSFVYFFSTKNTQLCAPISFLESISARGTIFVLHELIYRHHLWTSQVSARGNIILMSQFAYDPEFRNMVDRGKLCALVMREYFSKGLKAKIEEARHTLDLLQVEWRTHPERFDAPLLEADEEDIRDLLQLTSASAFKIDSLSIFENRLDVYDIDDLENTDAEQIQKNETFKVTEVAPPIKMEKSLPSPTTHDNNNNNITTVAGIMSCQNICEEDEEEIIYCEEEDLASSESQESTNIFDSIDQTMLIDPSRSSSMM